MSWFSKRFGRDRQAPPEVEASEGEGGAQQTSVSMSLDAGNLREVRDDVVAALDDVLAGHDPDLLHLMDPTRMLRWEAGGPPVWSIATARVGGPEPYWLWVTYGFSGLLSPVDYRQDYLHEYSIAVPCGADREPPLWPAVVLRQLTHYVLDSGAELRVGDNIPCGMPITHVGFGPDEAAQQPTTALDALLVGPDPLVPLVQTPHGELEVRRFVGLHPAERELLQRWNGRSLYELLYEAMPQLTCALDRSSALDDPELAARAEARSAKEGSSLGMLFVQGGWRPDGEAVVLTLPGGVDAKTVAGVLRARLPFGRPLILRGPPELGPVVLEPADAPSMRIEDGAFVLAGGLEDPAFVTLLSALEGDAPDIELRFGS